MKVLVTGVATSGKTTIARELQKRGYHALDTELIDGLHVWVEKATGRKLTDLQVTSVEDWLNKFDPSWDEQRLREVLGESQAQITFYCGSAANQENLYGLFDKVILLAINDQTMVDRLHAKDRTNEFGRRPGELEVLLGWYKGFQKRTEAVGALVIDATQPLEKVVDDILRHANHDN